MPKVIGSRMDMAPTGPIPGRTPTRVPMKHPEETVEKIGGLQDDLEARPDAAEIIHQYNPNAVRIPGGNLTPR